MNKNYIRGIAITVIALAIFNILAFAIPFMKTGTFWTGYVFGMAAILLQPLVFYYSFNDGKNLRSKFYGYPIARISVIYLGIQTALSFLVMALSFIPAWIPAAVFAILLLAAALGFIAADAMREEIERQDAVLVKDVTKMRSICSLGMALPAQCTDAELKRALESFAEHLRFADPVSSPALADIENELETLTGELQRAITDGDINGAKEICKRADAALTERNRLCKLNKGKN